MPITVPLTMTVDESVTDFIDDIYLYTFCCVLLGLPTYYVVMTFMIERKNTVREIGANERPSSDAERRLHQTGFPRMEEAVGFGVVGPISKVGYGESTPICSPQGHSQI